MKLLFNIIILLTFYISTTAQINPIRWGCQSVKQSENIFEIRFTAKIDEPWHIYAPEINENLGLPTTFSIYPSPLFSLDGKIIYDTEPITERFENTELKYFEGKVTFIQKIKVKGNMEFTLNGMVEYMCCANGHCLPPAKKRFSVTIDNTKK